jgi:hypothetical protein
MNKRFHDERNDLIEIFDKEDKYFAERKSPLDIKINEHNKNRAQVYTFEEIW